MRNIAAVFHLMVAWASWPLGVDGFARLPQDAARLLGGRKPTRPWRLAEPTAAVAQPGGLWEDLSGDGGVLKRLVSPGRDDGAARPRRRSLCNIDLELRLLHTCGGGSNSDSSRDSNSSSSGGDSNGGGGDDDQGELLGRTTGYTFLLRGQGEVLSEGPAAKGGIGEDALRGFHLALPTMRTGEVADLRLRWDYAFGADGVPAPSCVSEGGAERGRAIPPGAAVGARITLRHHAQYASGEPGPSEVESWDARVRADPMLKQSTIATYERIEEAEAEAKAAAKAAAKAGPAPKVGAGGGAAGRSGGPGLASGRPGVGGSQAGGFSGGGGGGGDGGSGGQGALADTQILGRAQGSVAPPSSCSFSSSAGAASPPSPPQPPAMPSVGARKARPRQSARLISDPAEVAKGVRVDPRMRVRGVESAPASHAAGNAAGAAPPSGAPPRPGPAVVSWDETLATIDVLVAFPPRSGSTGSTGSTGSSGKSRSGVGEDTSQLLRAAELAVHIGKRRIRVGIRRRGGSGDSGGGGGGKDAGAEEEEVLAAGDLAGVVDPDASFWWIEDGRALSSFAAEAEAEGEGAEAADGGDGGGSSGGGGGGGISGGGNSSGGGVGGGSGSDRGSSGGGGDDGGGDAAVGTGARAGSALGAVADAEAAGAAVVAAAGAATIAGAGAGAVVPHVVRLSLVKGKSGIWAGVWKEPNEGGDSVTQLP